MDTRPLARGSPRKSSVPHQGPSGSRRRGGPGARTPKSPAHPARPAVPRVHRTMARRRVGVVQPLAGSLAGASRSRSILRGAWGRWRRPTQVLRLVGQPRRGVAGNSGDSIRICWLERVSAVCSTADPGRRTSSVCNGSLTARSRTPWGERLPEAISAIPQPGSPGRRGVPRERACSWRGQRGGGDVSGRQGGWAVERR